MLVQKKKIDEVKGTQCAQTGNEYESNEVHGGQHLGDGVKKHPYLKYYRFKPDCHGSGNCKFTSKAERSVINTQEIINQKLKDLNEAK